MSRTLIPLTALLLLSACSNAALMLNTENGSGSFSGETGIFGSSAFSGSLNAIIR